MLEQADAHRQVQQREVGSRKSTSPKTKSAQYYDAHLDEFGPRRSVTLREILVNVPATRQEGVERRRADEARKARPKASARASSTGRELREAGRRGVGLAVEGQRRADRPDLSAMKCRRSSAS